MLCAFENPPVKAARAKVEVRKQGYFARGLQDSWNIFAFRTKSALVIFEERNTEDTEYRAKRQLDTTEFGEARKAPHIHIKTNTKKYRPRMTRIITDKHRKVGVWICDNPRNLWLEYFKQKYSLFNVT